MELLELMELKEPQVWDEGAADVQAAEVRAGGGDDGWRTPGATTVVLATLELTNLTFGKRQSRGIMQSWSPNSREFEAHEYVVKVLVQASLLGTMVAGDVVIVRDADGDMACRASGAIYLFAGWHLDGA